MPTQLNTQIDWETLADGCRAVLAGDEVATGKDQDGAGWAVCCCGGGGRMRGSSSGGGQGELRDRITAEREGGGELRREIV